MTTKDMMLKTDAMDVRRMPTRWWRSVSSDLLDATALMEMKAAAAGSRAPGEPRWRRAVAGDAAAAIGLVLGVDPRQMAGGELDLAMTLLAICALEGNDAACVVLSHAIRRLPGAGPAEARIATSWLVHAFKKMTVCGAGKRPRKGAAS
jgi:hypothetical protein